MMKQEQQLPAVHEQFNGSAKCESIYSIEQ